MVTRRAKKSVGLIARLGLTGKDVGTILLALLGGGAWYHDRQQANTQVEATGALLVPVAEQTDSLWRRVDRLEAEIRRLKAGRVDGEAKHENGARARLRDNRPAVSWWPFSWKQRR